jgi:phosphoglycerate dehydrogenase-like enzyme
MPQAAFFSDQPKAIERVYGGGRREQLQIELDFYPTIISTENFEQFAPDLANLEFIFSTWGMPRLSTEQIQRMPALKVVFYAAGSVHAFAPPFLERGVQVVSAWEANGLPVAQFTLAQIILAAKGFFSAERACQTSAGRENFVSHYPGLLGTNVSILGAGMIGSKVIELIKPLQMEIFVFDPFLNESRAAYLGVQKVSLVEAFEGGFVISNHIADLPETKNLLTHDLFERMQPYATFINTGRGATVDEKGMLEVMEKRPDLTALLDVTDPEPPRSGSPIYRLANVFLSPHIASNLGNEVRRQADCVIQEYHRFKNGEKMKYSVTMSMLATMG